MKLILTCEHAGNYVPEEYTAYFKGAGATLNTHKAIDFGALELAKYLASKLHAPLHYNMVTRLIVEANRSKTAPDLFSDFTRELNDNQKKDTLQKYYAPYRDKIENQVASITAKGEKVFHLSVHSFTPVFKGDIRDVDIGLLFDPARELEKEICGEWMQQLKKAGQFIVKYNEPYKGTDDGFTTYLRTRFPGNLYAGIEIEVNQKYPLSKNKKTWKVLMLAVMDSLKETINTSRIVNPVH
jgi:predicted N-formylglutamate amidohydrolase